MAFAAYCKLEGIKGESSDENHEDWIEITSYNHTVAQRHNMGGGTGGLAGQGADSGTFGITKVLDKSTADLNKFCALGEHIPTIEVEICMATKGHQPFMKYTLKNALISSVTPMGSDGDAVRPMEEVEFAYDEIAWKYTAYKDKEGSKEGEYKAGWNLATNEATAGE
jgi:type VI secretion system secreted protein Hcp